MHINKHNFFKQILCFNPKMIKCMFFVPRFCGLEISKKNIRPGQGHTQMCPRVLMQLVDPCILRAPQLDELSDAADLRFYLK